MRITLILCLFSTFTMSCSSIHTPYTPMTNSHIRKPLNIIYDEMLPLHEFPQNFENDIDFILLQICDASETIVYLYIRIYDQKSARVVMRVEVDEKRTYYTTYFLEPYGRFMYFYIQQAGKNQPVRLITDDTWRHHLIRDAVNYIMFLQEEKESDCTTPTKLVRLPVPQN